MSATKCTTKSKKLYLTPSHLCPIHQQNANSNKELVSSYVISDFENSLIKLEIGTEIQNDKKLMTYLKNTLGTITPIRNSQAFNDFNNLTAGLITDGNDNINGSRDLRFHPSILLLNVDNKRRY